MARVGLNLDVRDLARRASLGSNTVSLAERGERPTREATLNKLRLALEAAGAEFKPGGWVRAVAAALRLGGKADSPIDAAKPDESGL